MRKKYLLKIVVVFLSVFLVACQQNDSKSNSNSSVGLYGTVITIDKEKKIELDITVWSREVGDLSNEDDVGAVKVIEVKENTLIKYENGKTAKLADIHENQKVKVVETAAGNIKELILKK